MIEEYRSRLRDNSVAMRLAAHAAALQMAAILAEGALILPWRYPHFREVDQVLLDVVRSTAGDEQAEEALEYVLDWAVANSGKFWTLSGPNRWHAEWVGRWDGRDEDGTRQRTEIGFVKKTVNGLLKARGYDAAKVVSMWRANGWLRDTPGRNGLKTRMGAGEPYLITITAAVVNRYLGGENESEESPDGEGHGDGDASAPLASVHPSVEGHSAQEFDGASPANSV